MAGEYDANEYGAGVVLTAKYRLVWDEDGLIEGNPEVAYDRRIGTYVSAGKYAFESDRLSEIKVKILELGLTMLYYD